MAHIDYYFTVLSPFAYLAGDRMERVAEHHGATISYKPVDIMKLFSEMGGTPPAQRHESRKEYRMQELKRLSNLNDMPMNFSPAHWPTDQKPASALIVAAQAAGVDAGALARAVMKAVWAEERDIADEAILDMILSETGIDKPTLAPHMDAARDAFDTMTDEGMAAGVFGAPFYIVDGQRFWGQDRIAHLDAHLAGKLG
jgi:2-hydroxychromene-2-carboxylate isomerase